MPSRVRAWCVVALAMAAPGTASGQDLMTTPIGFRSGMTEGAITTRPGTLTVDAGASARWAGGTAVYRIGELNLRVPFSRRVEGRVYANSWSRRESPAGVETGREDLSVALAATVMSHRRLRPVLAIILRLDTPTGTLPGGESAWRPGLRWSVGWELPGRVALHGNLGLARESRAGVGFGREVASVWVSRRLAGRLGAYAEAFGATRERPGGPTAGYLHGALTWLVLPWMHMDLHGGVGSAGAGSPRWIGIGVRQRA